MGASDANGEPIINEGNGFSFDALSSVLATGTTVNLNTMAGLKYEQYNTSYSGAKSTGSMISYLASLSETRIGGGTYGNVYNPS